MTEIKTKPGWFTLFRILFGALIIFGAFRFFYNGWIDALYVRPVFHFSFPCFSWIKVMPPACMYLLFGLMMLCGLAISMNRLYKPATLLFFIIFTYIELIDVTYYLNHYYLVSLLSFILIFYDSTSSASTLYNQRIIFFLKFQISLVYFFGGLNKMEPDWLWHAQPLKIWLGAHNDLPLIGKVFTSPAVAYMAAWSSMAFDLLVSIALWFRRTRLAAYICLCTFHVLTALLFHIGIFPWIMIISTLLFFERTVPAKNILSISFASRGRYTFFILSCVAVWQMLFPLRHFLYPGNYLWTEQGFRFSWNIMLMEKNGTASFGVRHTDGHMTDVDEKALLTPFQVKMMSTQPDLIIQFAEYIREENETRKATVTGVYAECYVSLNGRRAALYFDPRLNLLTTRHELLKNIRAHYIAR